MTEGRIEPWCINPWVAFQRVSNTDSGSRSCVNIARVAQPYMTGENPEDATMQKLWILHELTNIDKHQTLHLAGFHLKTAEYRMNHPRDVIKDGTVLARIEWTEPINPNAKMGMDFHLSFDVTLKDVRPKLQSGGIEDMLSQITIHVASRVSEFERFFVQ